MNNNMNNGMNNMNNMNNNMNNGMNNMNNNMNNGMNNMNNNMNNGMNNMNNNMNNGMNNMNNMPNNGPYGPMQYGPRPSGGNGKIVLFIVGGVVLVAGIVVLIIVLAGGGGNTVRCTIKMDDYGTEEETYKFSGEGKFKSGSVTMTIDCSKTPSGTCNDGNACDSIEGEVEHDFKIVNCKQSKSGNKIKIDADLELAYKEDADIKVDVKDFKSEMEKQGYSCK